VELALNVIPIQHQAKPSPPSHWDLDHARSLCSSASSVTLLRAAAGA